MQAPLLSATFAASVAAAEYSWTDRTMMKTMSGRGVGHAVAMSCLNTSMRGRPGMKKRMPVQRLRERVNEVISLLKVLRMMLGVESCSTLGLKMPGHLLVR